jgi:hypothetical protein
MMKNQSTLSRRSTFAYLRGSVQKTDGLANDIILPVFGRPVKKSKRILLVGVVNHVGPR